LLLVVAAMTLGAECPEYSTCFYADDDLDGWLRWVGEHLHDGVQRDYQGNTVLCFEDTGRTGAEDCDDSNPSVHPGASEVCGDEVDDDCDGSIRCPVDWMGNATN